MKRGIALLLFTMLMFSILQAQSDSVFYDTITGRYQNCYYYDWFDECSEYTDKVACHFFPTLYRSELNDVIMARKQCVPGKIAIKGVAVMVRNEVDDREANVLSYVDSSRIAEYVVLFRYPEFDTTADTNLVMVDSARWDTVLPKVMKIRLSSEMDTFAYCQIYETYFDSVYYMDTTYFIGGTTYNNNVVITGIWLHYITQYMLIGEVASSCEPLCGSMHNTKFYIPSSDLWFDNPWESREWGPFLPILAKMYHLEVATSDERQGGVDGGGDYAEQTTNIIRAVPAEGYHFSHWNDGDTTNPRLVRLSQDTLFMAYFDDGLSYVEVQPNDEDFGYVTGGGTYYDGDTVTITAMPRGAYRFDRWDDGDTANPRRFVITQDTSFTAFFAPRHTQGIDTLADAAGGYTVVPNPADDAVTVEGPAPVAEVAVYDMGGRQVALHRSAAFGVADLPAGAYLLRITARDGTTARLKLVKR